MFKIKKKMCVAALLAAAIIGTTVYAAVANPTMVSSMVPLGVLTNVTWVDENKSDNAQAEPKETIRESVTGSETSLTCPTADFICKSADEDLASISSARPYLGVKVTPIHRALYAHVPGLSHFDHGVMVEGVVEASPAMKAGLQVYDLITQVNDETVESPQHLAQVVESATVGDEIALTLVRQGSEVSVKVELEAAPHDGNVASMFWLSPMDSFGFGPTRFVQDWFKQSWPARNVTPGVGTGSNSATECWSEFQSMKMSRDTDGDYDVSINYEKNGDSVERQYKGTRNEIMAAIDQDAELSDTLKKRLRGSLTEEPKVPAKLANEMVNKMRKHFDRPFFQSGILEFDPWKDSWIEDDWMNNDWFKRPIWMEDLIFEDDFGVATPSSEQASVNLKK